MRPTPPSAIWTTRRRLVWERDGHQCVRCHVSLEFRAAMIDHLDNGPRATHEQANLRTLCRRCFVLREANLKTGLTANALRDGVIEPNWREQVWSDAERRQRPQETTDE